MTIPCYQILMLLSGESQRYELKITCQHPILRNERQHIIITESRVDLTFFDVPNPMAHPHNFGGSACDRCNGQIFWKTINIRLLSFVQEKP